MLAFGAKCLHAKRFLVNLGGHCLIPSATYAIMTAPCICLYQYLWKCPNLLRHLLSFLLSACQLVLCPPSNSLLLWLHLINEHPHSTFHPSIVVVASHVGISMLQWRNQGRILYGGTHPILCQSTFEYNNLLKD